MLQKPEFWVMREAATWPREALAQLPMMVSMRDPATGRVHEFVNLGDVLAEPVEVFQERELAYEHMGQVERKHPGERFRVVFACDVAV